MNAALMKMLKDMLGVDPEMILKTAEDMQRFGNELVARLDRLESRLTNIERVLTLLVEGLQQHGNVGNVGNVIHNGNRIGNGNANGNGSGFDADGGTAGGGAAGA